MKALLLPIIFAFSTAINAETKANNEVEEATCLLIGQLAKGIMTARQSGTPMSKVINLLGGEASTINDLARQLIIDAYEQPRFSGDKYQQRAITEFENEAMVMCYKA
jgi:hypothetical protein